jgi:FkbM family methyltransferase
VLDVGANVGGWSLAARRNWPHADIHAFEPAAATYALLSAAVQDADVTVVRAACGASTGVVTLHSVPGLPGLTSVYPRDLLEHRLEMSGIEDVPMITVDDYCSDIGIDRIDFLKVDAEGHDLAVLHGAASMLNTGRIRFVQFEFGGANIDSRTFLRDFVRLLEPRYALSRLLVNGLESLAYSEAEEIFMTANFLAELRPTGDDVWGSTKT